jgi:hypothetical protein
MSVDYSIMLDPQYTIHGVEAVLTVACGHPAKDVTVLDKSAGIALGENVEVQTMKPAACIRVAELAEHDIARADLPGGTIEFNDKVWKIEATMPRVTPTGEATGELLLLLSEESDD